MEANVNNYFFKLDRSIKQIEVFFDYQKTRPIGYINVDENITEKEFHTEVSYWIINNSNTYTA